MYLWTKMVIFHCHVSENYMDNILPASWYGHYHYHIQNDEPMFWPFSKSNLSLETPKFMLGFAMNIKNGRNKYATIPKLWFLGRLPW